MNFTSFQFLPLDVLKNNIVKEKIYFYCETLDISTGTSLSTGTNLHFVCDYMPVFRKLLLIICDWEPVMTGS